jgi:hypothetical protein
MADPIERVRLIECWLPLAQAIDQEQGWGCDGATLELLIMIALPSLLRACSAAEARAILVRVHYVHRSATR